MGYRLRYSRLDGRSRTLTNTIHDRMEREFTIEDLEEWTEYRVQVQAFNAIGPGPWSQTVVGRTRESGTLSPPRLVTRPLRQSGIPSHGQPARSPAWHVASGVAGRVCGL